MTRLRQWLVTGLLLALMLGLGAALWILPDQALSYTERRKLAQRPELSAEAVFSSAFSGELEDYLLDQFPAREAFRRLKAQISFGLLRRQDNNGIYLWQDGVYRQEYPLNEDQLRYGARKLNTLFAGALEGMNVSYAVIPDKNCYAAGAAGQLHLDYDQLRETLRAEIDSGIREIALYDCLDAGDYFRTDPHWRQERLERVLARLGEALEIALPTPDSYTPASFAPFYGAYYGQAALPVEPDTLYYLESDTTRGATVTTLDTGETAGLYQPEAYDGMDGYDLFLGGAAAVQVLHNPGGPAGKELVIFRDSFASSLAPLLLEAYETITLIDLRYISAERACQLVTFDHQDVLFLLSTLVWNHAAMLR